MAFSLVIYQESVLTLFLIGYCKLMPAVSNYMIGELLLGEVFTEWTVACDTKLIVSVS